MRLTIKQDQMTPTLKGTIKWFSKEKGYGFIVGSDDINRFFHVTDTAGDFTPEAGHFIFFEPRQDRKGPRAVSVHLNPNSLVEVNRIHRHGRIACPHCSRLIVPRMTFWYGRPNRSFCPYCAGVIRNFFRDSTLGVFLDMIVHVATFSVYVLAFLIGLYLLVTVQRDSSAGQAVLGLTLVAPVVYRIFERVRRLVSGIWFGVGQD